MERASDGSITYALLRDTGPRLGDAETGPPYESFDDLDQAIAGLLHDSLEDSAEALVRAANQSGGKDNITVVLFRLSGDAEVDAAKDDETIAGTLTAEDVHAAAADAPTPARSDFRAPSGSAPRLSRSSPRSASCSSW